VEGPVEGWLVRSKDVVGFVKGCFHPLPWLVYVPRLVGGAKTWSIGRFGANISRCFDFPVPLVDSRRASLTSPIDAAKRLAQSGCESRVCRAGLRLLAILASAVGLDAVGVTGGLAYAPFSAGDVDVVVYGWRAGLEAYRVLRELREEGTTEPHYG
jgi:hypothetical protein